MGEKTYWPGFWILITFLPLALLVIALITPVFVFLWLSVVLELPNLEIDSGTLIALIFLSIPIVLIFSVILLLFKIEWDLPSYILSEHGITIRSLLGRRKELIDFSSIRIATTGEGAFSNFGYSPLLKGSGFDIRWVLLEYGSKTTRIIFNNFLTDDFNEFCHILKMKIGDRFLFNN